MFFRQKKSGSRVYLQVVENRWEDGRSKQRVIATLGRLDQLQESGQLEGLLRIRSQVLRVGPSVGRASARRNYPDADAINRTGHGLRATVARDWMPRSDPTTAA